MNFDDAQTDPVHAPKTANINEENLTVYNTLQGRLLQNRRTKTANVTKDDNSSQHSDISAMCCELILSFVIFAVLVLRFCCSCPYKVL